MADVKKRQRLVHTYFDRATSKHQIFVYNKEQKLIAHLTISPTGNIEILQGQITQPQQEVNKQQ